ncbi:hypothetical protein ACSAZK_09445 [Methanosarcina sp. Mfa9]|uniref:hypothetical protein n=1 Tax=Methanosarcina sp. Mfa9 TaxID=3439063 RepID=UPI003F868E21
MVLKAGLANFYGIGDFMESKGKNSGKKGKNLAGLVFFMDSICYSTVAAAIAILSWIFYSIDLISLELEVNIILLMMVIFILHQLFGKDSSSNL